MDTLISHLPKATEPKTSHKASGQPLVEEAQQLLAAPKSHSATIPEGLGEEDVVAALLLMELVNGKPAQGHVHERREEHTLSPEPVVGQEGEEAKGGAQVRRTRRRRKAKRHFDEK